MNSPKLNTVSYKDATFMLFDQDDIAFNAIRGALVPFQWSKFQGMTSIGEAIDQAVREDISEMCYADKWDLMTMLDGNRLNYYLKLRLTDYEQEFADALENAIADIVRDKFLDSVHDLALLAAAFRAFAIVGKDTISQAAWESICNVVGLYGEDSLADCSCDELHGLILPILTLEMNINGKDDEPCD